MNGDFFFPIPPYTVLSPPISPHTSGIQECDAMASRSSLEYDYLFKIVLVGDAAVGKTNLLACYTSQVCFLSDHGGCFGCEVEAPQVLSHDPQR